MTDLTIHNHSVSGLAVAGGQSFRFLVGTKMTTKTTDLILTPKVVYYGHFLNYYHYIAIIPQSFNENSIIIIIYR